MPLIILRYQPIPSLIKRLEDMHQQCRNVTKKCEHLKGKLDKIVQSEGLPVGNQLHQDIQQVCSFSCM